MCFNHKRVKSLRKTPVLALRSIQLTIQLLIEVRTHKFNCKSSISNLACSLNHNQKKSWSILNARMWLKCLTSIFPKKTNYKSRAWLLLHKPKIIATSSPWFQVHLASLKLFQQQWLKSGALLHHNRICKDCKGLFQIREIKQVKLNRALQLSAGLPRSQWTSAQNTVEVRLITLIESKQSFKRVASQVHLELDRQDSLKVLSKHITSRGKADKSYQLRIQWQGFVSLILSLQHRLL